MVCSRRLRQSLLPPTRASSGGTRIKPKDSPSPDLDVPQTVNLGLGLDVSTRAFMVRLVIDALDTTHSLDLASWERLAAGAEVWLTPNLGLTTGLHDGYPAGGVFTDFTLLRLDAGAYTEEMGARLGDRPDRRFFARVTLGF